MWYVMQVRTGTEESVCRQCNVNIPTKVLKKSFVPLSEERKKIRGEWMTLKHRLFPGYVFLDCEDIVEVMRHLRRVEGLTRILTVGDEIVPLTEEEMRFMWEFGGEEQIVELSEIYIEGEQVEILGGPLKGKEALIKKIDKHKRKVYLEMEMFGRLQRVEVGFAFGMKKAEEENEGLSRQNG